MAAGNWWPWAMRRSEQSFECFPMSGYEPSPDPTIEHNLDDLRTTPEHALRTEVRVKIAEMESRGGRCG